MFRKAFSLVVLPLALSMVAGCGTDSVEQVVAQDLEISIMKDSGVGHFHNPNATIGVGGSVTWVNRSGVVHNVVFDDRSLQSSPLLNDGESFTATFDKPGSYRYICTIHPAMIGTVAVE